MNPVRVEQDGPVAVITLNRPDALNALNSALRQAFARALDAANTDPDVRAVVITGAGDRAFSAGIDLKETSQADKSNVGDVLSEQRAVYQAVRDLYKGCVVAFNGVAAGAGFQIGLCADMRDRESIVCAISREEWVGGKVGGRGRIRSVGLFPPGARL